MSTLYVDTITEKTAGNGVQIADLVPAAGSVVQVINNTWTGSNQTINGTTLTEVTNLTTSITPLLTGSKVLVQSNVDFGNSFNGGLWYKWRLYRDTTSNLIASAGTYFNVQYGGPIGPHMLFNTIDSNTTTAGVSRSYKIYAAADTSASGVLLINWANAQNSTSSITLMEIAQ